MNSYDYIVVGGGAAGSVLAARLSEDRDARVLLLEAGRNLGGSAVYHARGHRSSYDRWGIRGWGFDELLPYFRRSETTVGTDHAVRGDRGPMLAGRPPRPSALSQAWIDAAWESGFDAVADPVAGTAIGFGLGEATIVAGRRQTAFDAYLRPAMSRANLQVTRFGRATALTFDGRRCSGVRYLAHDVPQTATARREVVVCAGAVGSPQLLMLSGIGPGAELRRVGITRVVCELSDVGANLHDHVTGTVAYRSPREVGRPEDWAPGEAVGLVCSSGDGMPDIQALLHNAPLADPGPAGHSMDWCIGFSHLLPRSRGRLRLTSSRPDAPPSIDPAYLSDDRDVHAMARGLGIARRLGAAEALAPWREAEITPGAVLDHRDRSAVRSYLRRTRLASHHFAGTCRMDAVGGVVDALLRVRWVERLRVADASVLPSLPSAAPNATVLAIAERAASLILGGAATEPVHERA